MVDKQFPTNMIYRRNYLFGVLRTNDQMNWLLMHKVWPLFPIYSI